MLVLLLLTVLLLQQSCKKKETAPETDFLSVTLPNSTLQNDLYYTVNDDVRFVELEFSEPLDTTTVQGNVSISDKNTVYDSSVSLLVLDRKVVLMFHPSFKLQNGWKYSITLTTGLKSVSGLALPSLKIIEIRTPAFSLLDGDVMQRNAILCISDIHMGEYRAVTNNYCWFSENNTALADLLDLVLTTPVVKQVVILGDLFDEWVIPYRFAPFDSAAGVHDSRGYFLSVANSPVNAPVLSKLRAIAASNDIQLIYVPGNHDMLLTRQVLEEIIPGVVWKGTVPAIGEYLPVDEIIMEHGHRFDFFNCPQPLVNTGHMLPPGFFVSRLQAECSRTHPGTILKESSDAGGSLEFNVAWRLALDYLEIQYNMKVNEDSVNIAMSGIDGYTSPFSYNSAKNMYATDIETNWNATQAANQVPVNLPVLMAILDGQSDLFTAVGLEYFSPLSPKKYQMAVFGHTHNPELKVFPSGKHYTSIYANTGSWVNASMSKYKVRTFVMIWPGKWTGSDLDIVSLYQYNLKTIGGPNPDYQPDLIAEESIIRGN